jgi:hypothetical protein
MRHADVGKRTQVLIVGDIWTALGTAAWGGGRFAARVTGKGRCTGSGSRWGFTFLDTGDRSRGDPEGHGQTVERDGDGWIYLLGGMKADERRPEATSDKISLT